MTEKEIKKLKKYQREAIRANDFYNILYSTANKPFEWFQQIVYSYKFDTLGDPKYDVICELVKAYLNKRKFEQQIDRKEEKLDTLKTEGGDPKKIERMQTSIAQKNCKILKLNNILSLVDEEEANYHL